MSNFSKTCHHDRVKFSLSSSHTARSRVSRGTNPNHLTMPTLTTSMRGCVALAAAVAALAMPVAAKAENGPSGPGNRDPTAFAGMFGASYSATPSPPPPTPLNGTWFAGVLTNEAVLQRGADTKAAVFGAAAGVTASTKVCLRSPHVSQPVTSTFFCSSSAPVRPLPRSERVPELPFMTASDVTMPVYGGLNPEETQGRAQALSRGTAPRCVWDQSLIGRGARTDHCDSGRRRCASHHVHCGHCRPHGGPCVRDCKPHVEGEPAAHILPCALSAFPPNSQRTLVSVTRGAWSVAALSSTSPGTRRQRDDQCVVLGL